MKSLRLLNLDGCSGDTIVFPKSLRYIRWHRMPMSELPSGVNVMRLLVALDLTSSKMTHLWHTNAGVTFPELRTLILVGCTALKELPNSITTSVHLRSLDLNDCTSLETVPHDIGCLQELEILNLQGCLKLVYLPESMRELTSLTHLSLSNCSNLISLPEAIGSCVMLSSLNLKGCISLVKLPHSVGRLRNLESLMTIGCSRLTDFPGSMEELAKLKCLWIGGRELKAVPLFIEHLAGTLEHLHVYRSEIESLPEFVFELTKLQAMTILGCHVLPDIPDSINGLKGTLKDLRFIHCSGLKRLPESMGDLTNLEILDLRACEHLETLPKTLGRLSNLQTLEQDGCKNLVEFPDAESISNLSTRCREKICEFIKFRSEQNIMAGRYDAAEQNVEYLMTLRPSDSIFQKLHELIDEKKHNLKSELALVSTDMEWLRQQAWQKVVVNDMQQAAAFVGRMVEVDPESEFALLCRSTLRTLVGDLKGSAADTKKMISDRARREQAGIALPQLYSDSLKKWKPFMDKLDIRGALLAILKVDGSEDAGTSGMAVSLPGKEELAVSAWKPQPARAAAFRKQAETMTGLGDYFGALVILDAAEKLDPDNVLTLSDRGNAKLSANDGPGAYGDFNRVLELDPNNAQAPVGCNEIRNHVIDKLDHGRYGGLASIFGPTF